ncbi:hypothetical protein ACX1DX_13420 [Tessaracoccus sp. Y36]
MVKKFLSAAAAAVLALGGAVLHGAGRLTGTRMPMKSMKAWLGAVIAAALAVTGLAFSSPAAQATAGEETIKLCGGVPTDGSTCSIAVDSQFLTTSPEEGVTLHVSVRGVPNVTVSLSAIVYEVRDADNRVMFAPLSDPVMVTPKKVKATDTVGVARASLKTRALPGEYTSQATIAVQPSDWRPVRGMVLNSADRYAGMDRVSLVSKRPRDRGFEAAPTKDGAFTRLLYNASSSGRYSVQLKQGTKWVPLDVNGPVQGAGAGITKLRGQLPVGLVSGRYEMRVVNVTHGETGLTPVGTPQQFMDWKLAMDSKLFNVYTTPGTWDLNGRKWRTTCEAYSATERCRTEIWATQILYQAGTFNRLDGWAFNNLTYKPSPRSLWKGNPVGGNGTVGHTGEWTATDGRKWRVECDTATSGRNGCRAYAMAKVAEPVSAGATTYRVVDTWLFNNIVQFT